MHKIFKKNKKCKRLDMYNIIYTMYLYRYSVYRLNRIIKSIIYTVDTIKMSFTYLFTHDLCYDIYNI